MRHVNMELVKRAVGRVPVAEKEEKRSYKHKEDRFDYVTFAKLKDYWAKHGELMPRKDLVKLLGKSQRSNNTVNRYYEQAKRRGLMFKRDGKWKLSSS